MKGKWQFGGECEEIGIFVGNLSVWQFVPDSGRAGCSRVWTLRGEL